MKGLLLTGLVIMVLIGLAAIAAVVITDDSFDRVAVSSEDGLADGMEQGYAVGLSDGMADGYQAGSRAGYAATLSKTADDLSEGFYFISNPSYEEVQKILAESNATTAFEINKYAEAHGIRTAYVRCQIARETEDRKIHLYNVVAFDTIDRGFIFIRPRTYQEIRVETGRRYSDLNSFPRPDYDDTITKITIYW